MIQYVVHVWVYDSTTERILRGKTRKNISKRQGGKVISQV